MLVLHIPHASVVLPAEYRPLFTLPEASLRRELLRMTDRYTDELFRADCPRIVAPVSRLVCDMERFRSDAEEPMAERGMGVCYTRGSEGQPLKSVTDAHRAEILRRYYDPHHAALSRTVRETLAAEGRCLLIDCHSFASSPLPYEPRQEPRRPDICLGTDPFHTPDALVRRFRDYFVSLGYTVDLNTPYDGVLVPMDCYHREPRLSAVMIEVNRRLYMDEATGDRLPSFPALRRQLAELLWRMG